MLAATTRHEELTRLLEEIAQVEVRLVVEPDQYPIEAFPLKANLEGAHHSYPIQAPLIQLHLPEICGEFPRSVVPPLFR